MKRVVVAAVAVVVLDGLAAAAPQPTRTPRSARGLTPTATPRLTVIRGPQGPRGAQGPQGAPGLAAVEYVRTSDTVRPRSGGHGIMAACPRGKRAIASGFIITSSPLLRVVLSEPLGSGSGRDSASGWFVQVANLDTRTHVASAEAVIAVIATRRGGARGGLPGEWGSPRPASSPTDALAAITSPMFLFQY